MAGWVWPMRDGAGRKEETWLCVGLWGKVAWRPSLTEGGWGLGGGALGGSEACVGEV